jgi:adenylate kinase family enzyme
MNSLHERVETFQNLLISLATQDRGPDADYATLRLELLGYQDISERLPSFLRTCRSPEQFWQFIKHKFAHYQERRAFIWDSFRPALEYLEALDRAPASGITTEVLTRVDSEHVKLAWKRALERRTNDPEGAITAARALLESTCKFILDETRMAYDENADLPALYGQVATLLKLAPAQHSEHAFKRILGGVFSVVEGLGALRNCLGDAHGKGKRSIRAGPRHAELAVNLAGGTATFLIATWETRKTAS